MGRAQHRRQVNSPLIDNRRELPQRPGGDTQAVGGGDCPIVRRIGDEAGRVEGLCRGSDDRRRVCRAEGERIGYGGAVGVAALPSQPLATVLFTFTFMAASGLVSF